MLNKNVLYKLGQKVLILVALAGFCIAAAKIFVHLCYGACV